MKMTKKEYQEYVKKKSPPSPLGRDLFRAFLVGGLICCVGQGITSLYMSCGLEKLDASTATSITLVFLGALSTGLGFYDDLARIGGAGTLVPITGFANAMVSPALEFKSEGYITGTSSKMFTIAGPVLVYGTSASVIYGMLLILLGKGK